MSDTNGPILNVTMTINEERARLGLPPLPPLMPMAPPPRRRRWRGPALFALFAAIFAIGAIRTAHQTDAYWGGYKVVAVAYLASLSVVLGGAAVGSTLRRQ